MQRFQDLIKSTSSGKLRDWSYHRHSRITDGVRVFTPEREAFHADLVKSILGEHKPHDQKPNAVLFVNRHCEQVASKLVDQMGFTAPVVSADKIKSMLPEYRQWNGEALQTEAWIVEELAVNQAVKDRQSFSRQCPAVAVGELCKSLTGEGYAVHVVSDEPCDGSHADSVNGVLVGEEIEPDPEVDEPEEEPVVDEPEDLVKNCGANGPDGKGFQKGNSCASGQIGKVGKSGSGKEKDKRSTTESTLDLDGSIKSPGGGFTYDPHNKLVPTEGLCLSIFPEHSKIIPASQVSLEGILEYVDDKADFWGEDSAIHVGGWHSSDEKDGETLAYLDMVVLFDESKMQEVLELGRKHGQRAGYNLRTGEEFEILTEQEHDEYNRKHGIGKNNSAS
ncbi:hypothetical protein [Rosistilla oblonga]|uniref:hypothetical protein n=1 Tax=Rosistilla oblonga TaxID=2527990 RepID=UPI003A96C01A